MLVADAYLVHVTRKMAEVCRLLNKTEEAHRFEAEYLELRRHFADLYVSKAGRTVSDSQTALALSLHFDLLTPSQRKVAVERLEELVRSNVFKVATGFAGTPIILDALAQNDKLHLAYRMLQEKQCPSWLYCVSMGATTIVSG
jgi:alpha-L-rhamnosidase